MKFTIVGILRLMTRTNVIVYFQPGVRDLKTYFMLISHEHEICPSYKF